MENLSHWPTADDLNLNWWPHAAVRLVIHFRSVLVWDPRKGAPAFLAYLAYQAVEVMLYVISSKSMSQKYKITWFGLTLKKRAEALRRLFAMKEVGCVVEGSGVSSRELVVSVDWSATAGSRELATFSAVGEVSVISGRELLDLVL